MRTATRAFVLGAILFALALGGYLFIFKPQNPEKLQDVTIGQVGNFLLYMPIYYASDKGFFEHEGLRVKIINTGGDEKSVAAVISGLFQKTSG